MGSSKRVLIILFAGVFALTSCAKRKEVKEETKITVPPPETTKVVTAPAKVETTRVLHEEKKDTTGFQGPIVVFEGDTTKKTQDTVRVVLPEEVASATTPETNAAPATPTKEKPQTGAVQTIIGYRVQIFATLKKQNAERVAKKARKVLSKPVYIEYIPPFYKVRVGDFKNRQDAEEYKEYLRANGYPDAFVVETEIKGS